MKKAMVAMMVLMTRISKEDMMAMVMKKTTVAMIIMMRREMMTMIKNCFKMDSLLKA